MRHYLQVWIVECSSIQGVQLGSPLTKIENVYVGMPRVSRMLLDELVENVWIQWKLELLFS